MLSGTPLGTCKTTFSYDFLRHAGIWSHPCIFSSALSHLCQGIRHVPNVFWTMTSQLILRLTLSGKVAEVWQANFQREIEWQMFTLSGAMLNVNPGQCPTIEQASCWSTHQSLWWADPSLGRVLVLSLWISSPLQEEPGQKQTRPSLLTMAFGAGILRPQLYIWIQIFGI